MTGPVAVDRVVVDRVVVEQGLMGRAMAAQAVPALTGAARVENAVGRAAIRAVLQVQAVGSGGGAVTVPMGVLLRNGWSNMQCDSTPMATGS